VLLSTTNGFGLASGITCVLSPPAAGFDNLQAAATSTYWNLLLLLGACVPFALVKTTWNFPVLKSSPSTFAPKSHVGMVEYKTRPAALASENSFGRSSALSAVITRPSLFDVKSTVPLKGTAATGA